MDAIILAAGEGTRLRPLTSTRPKPMLQVAGKTILEWDLEALARNGFNKAIVVVGYKRDVIVDYFGKKFNGIKLEYVNQREQLGTAHAVSMAEGKVKKEFLVMNGDLIVSEKLISNFIKDHKKNKSENSMCLVDVKDPSEFGIV
ncbi:MAG TPA: nucleotidyltransferase family protein, partial [Candidatus Altiarchaeales archaeon]|nr:nucleotidyltransferase family protein [Candidatus Altiarchaeales archaeon]